MSTRAMSPLVYRIALCEHNKTYAKTVSGFAVDTPHRICVHRSGGEWQATDYDTGYRINDWCVGRSRCAEEAIKKVSENVATGHYALCRAVALGTLLKAGLL